MCHDSNWYNSCNPSRSDCRGTCTESNWVTIHGNNMLQPKTSKSILQPRTGRPGTAHNVVGQHAWLVVAGQLVSKALAWNSFDQLWHCAFCVLFCMMTWMMRKTTNVFLFKSLQTWERRQRHATSISFQPQWPRLGPSPSKRSRRVRRCSPGARDRGICLCGTQELEASSSERGEKDRKLEDFGKNNGLQWIGFRENMYQTLGLIPCRTGLYISFNYAYHFDGSWSEWTADPQWDIRRFHWAYSVVRAWYDPIMTESTISIAHLSMQSQCW